MNDDLKPRDHVEAVALFRHALIGALCSRGNLTHGELAAELRELSIRPVLPPGADCTRCYGASTYEAWLYAYRRGGLDALKPKRRCDTGHGRKLNEQQCQLLLDIKRERPGVGTGTGHPTRRQQPRRTRAHGDPPVCEELRPRQGRG